MYFFGVRLYLADEGLPSITTVQKGALSFFLSFFSFFFDRRLANQLTEVLASPYNGTAQRTGTLECCYNRWWNIPIALKGTTFCLILSNHGEIV